MRRLAFTLLSGLLIALLAVPGASAQVSSSMSPTAGETTTGGEPTTTASQPTTTLQAATTTTGGTTTTTLGEETTTTLSATTTTLGEETTTTLSEEPPGIGEGRLSLEPASGPEGTAISVRSIDPCVPPKDAEEPVVGVFLLDGTTVEEELVTVLEVNVFGVEADGHWSGSLQVPEGAPAGEHFVDALCFPSLEEYELLLSSSGEEGTIYFIYLPASFTVTRAPAKPSLPPAPPAKPVTKTPTFTG